MLDRVVKPTEAPLSTMDECRIFLCAHKRVCFSWGALARVRVRGSVLCVSILGTLVCLLPTLSDWFVTFTSGFSRIACASSAVFSAHILRRASSNSSGALWIHLMTHRRSDSGVELRPVAVTYS